MDEWSWLNAVNEKRFLPGKSSPSLKRMALFSAHVYVIVLSRHSITGIGERKPHSFLSFMNGEVFGYGA